MSDCENEEIGSTQQAVIQAIGVNIFPILFFKKQ